MHEPIIHTHIFGTYNYICIAYIDIYLAIRNFRMTNTSLHQSGQALAWRLSLYMNHTHDWHHLCSSTNRWWHYVKFKERSHDTIVMTIQDRDTLYTSIVYQYVYIICIFIYTYYIYTARTLYYINDHFTWRQMEPCPMTHQVPAILVWWRWW